MPYGLWLADLAVRLITGTYLTVPCAAAGSPCAVWRRGILAAGSASRSRTRR
jgi:hypothetical protein